ncbi:hypothetical protein D3C87_1772660 [compost metagenome]
MEAQAAGVGPEDVVVLHPVAGEHADRAVVHPDGDVGVDHLVGGPEAIAHAAVQLEQVTTLLELQKGLLELVDRNGVGFGRH